VIPWFATAFCPEKRRVIVGKGRWLATPTRQQEFVTLNGKIWEPFAYLTTGKYVFFGNDVLDRNRNRDGAGLGRFSFLRRVARPILGPSRFCVLRLVEKFADFRSVPPVPWPNNGEEQFPSFDSRRQRSDPQSRSPVPNSGSLRV